MSAGTEPGLRVHPEVFPPCRRLALIDLSALQNRRLRSHPASSLHTSRLHSLTISGAFVFLSHLVRTSLPAPRRHFITPNCRSARLRSPALIPGSAPWSVSTSARGRILSARDPPPCLREDVYESLMRARSAFGAPRQAVSERRQAPLPKMMRRFLRSRHV